MSAALRQAAEAVLTAMHAGPTTDTMEVPIEYVTALRSALAASAAEEERARAALELLEAEEAFAAEAAFQEATPTPADPSEARALGLRSCAALVRRNEALARYRALKEPADA